MRGGIKVGMLEIKLDHSGRHLKFYRSSSGTEICLKFVPPPDYSIHWLSKHMLTQIRDYINDFLQEEPKSTPNSIRPGDRVVIIGGVGFEKYKDSVGVAF